MSDAVRDAAQQNERKVDQHVAEELLTGTVGSGVC
jgi:hypothetical protein